MNGSILNQCFDEVTSELEIPLTPPREPDSTGNQLKRSISSSVSRLNRYGRKKERLNRFRRIIEILQEIGDPVGTGALKYVVGVRCDGKWSLWVSVRNNTLQPNTYNN